MVIFLSETGESSMLYYERELSSVLLLRLGM